MMQKIIENETPLFVAQFNSSAMQKKEKEEAEAACDSALNARIESLEQKIHSILQENLKIEAELNQAHDLYQQRKEKNVLEKKEILREIAPLEEQATQLNTAIEKTSKENLELSQKISASMHIRDLTRNALLYMGRYL